ncbi:MAG TPA: hypothetical protein DCE42_05520 [Myxococcales bacterium]|nr:hypothetical protein [Deltaproteobacteria bacterium]HAA54192.1 hypothetical protein [Myxococcales bacterium]
MHKLVTFTKTSFGNVGGHDQMNDHFGFVCWMKSQYLARMKASLSNTLHHVNAFSQKNPIACKYNLLYTTM